MKKFRNVLLGTLLFYHFFSAYITIYIDQHFDKLLRYMDYLPIGAIIGLVLFLTYFTINYLDVAKLKKSISGLESETVNLKAKLYDKKEAEQKETPAPTNESEKE
ncbi:hypothetical protein QWY31_04005 [Cytophagales bacterium LB-30]|uniref:DUF1049 domain-containing protein n=1 Tax=Shiella aurantiaca TaxID=3058365 RepID=A0ABT8F354_9BACT|nr:hypothetical protein [Shiella aurantiaca]MDN4164651.1 hypothetical protein [Shiella aurantiaca]